MNKTRRYYAATLKGLDEPKAIENVFVFQYPSQRNQWVKENGVYLRIRITAKVAKNHKPIEVGFAKVAGNWAWIYEGCSPYRTEI